MRTAITTVKKPVGVAIVDYLKRLALLTACYKRDPKRVESVAKGLEEKPTDLGRRESLKKQGPEQRALSLFLSTRNKLETVDHLTGHPEELYSLAKELGITQEGVMAELIRAEQDPASPFFSNQEGGASSLESDLLAYFATTARMPYGAKALGISPNKFKELLSRRGIVLKSGRGRPPAGLTAASVAQDSLKTLLRDAANTALVEGYEKGGIETARKELEGSVLKTIRTYFDEVGITTNEDLQEFKKRLEVLKSQYDRKEAVAQLKEEFGEAIVPLALSLLGKK